MKKTFFFLMLLLHFVVKEAVAFSRSSVYQQDTQSIESFLRSDKNTHLSNLYTFGTKSSSNKSTHIFDKIIYTPELGYGFEANTQENLEIKTNCLQVDSQVYFSVKVPEGNYKVTVVFDTHKNAVATLKAESKRLMVAEFFMDKNTKAAQSFIVNVRTPKINHQKEIRLKKRELDYFNWDDKLTLEFLGDFAIKSIKITPVKNIQTIYLAGDSTVTDQEFSPWAAWGQFLPYYFKPNISIANYAASGASLQSFKSRKRLDKIMSVIQKEDYLFIEFGHNDEKIKGAGNGAWGLYTNLLKEFVLKARAKGAIPVLCTPTQRRLFDKNGRLISTHRDFPNAVRAVAKELKVPLIDLTKMTTKMYEAWGVETSKNAFVHYDANTFVGQSKTLKDNTHFNDFGANEIAKCILQGVRDLNLSIAKKLKQEIPKYNPQKPNTIHSWKVPLSPRFQLHKPDGN